MSQRRRIRLEDWIPKQSIVGRIVHPLFEERRTLAGRMSWIGIGILVAFLVVAIGANLIAPFDPILPVDEKNIPPWTEAVVPRNESFTAWSGNWTSIAAGQRIDGLGAVSNRSLQVETLTSFAVDAKRDAIASVGLQALLLPVGTDPGQSLGVEVSPDAGTTWLPRVEIQAVGALVRVDLSDLRAWHADDLTRQTLQLRITHLSTGGAPGNLSVDFLSVTAEWRTFWHLMGTDAIGRDVFSRVLYGTRTSLIIMVIAVSTAFVIGFPVGLYSGYRGGTAIESSSWSWTPCTLSRASSSRGSSPCSSGKGSSTLALP